jgi:hypothetical protein
VGRFLLGSDVHQDGQVIALDGRARRWALMGAVFCLCLFAGLAVGLHGVDGPVTLDVRAASVVFSRPFGIRLVPYLIASRFELLGNTAPFAVLVAGVAAVGLWRRDWLVTAVGVVGPPLAVVLSELSKRIVGRSVEGVLSFPSGHVAAMAAIVVVVVLLAYRHWGLGGLASAAPLALLLPVGMVVTVVRIQAHTMSDAIGGVALGVGTVLALSGAGSMLVAAATIRRVEPQAQRL